MNQHLLPHDAPSAPRSLRRSLVFCLSLSVVFLSSMLAGAAPDYFPPPDSAGGWRTLSEPEEIRSKAGMDASRLETAFRICERGTQHGGLLVVRLGWLVFERYFGRASRNANPDMASTGKAYTSIACGVMLDEFRDKIPEGLDTKVFSEKYLPQAFPLNDPRSLSDLRVRIKINAPECPLSRFYSDLGLLPWSKTGDFGEKRAKPDSLRGKRISGWAICCA
jgi:hypothetical protein